MFVNLLSKIHETRHILSQASSSVQRDVLMRAHSWNQSGQHFYQTVIFIWTERKTRGTASEDRTLKVRRTWSWKHLNDCVMSDWPPAPRRQRSAVDVPVSFRQGGDLWGERQHGVTAGRSFKLGGGGDYPQYTATYLQRGETLTAHVGAWWTLTLTTFCW